jgi:hypothetical protein
MARPTRLLPFDHIGRDWRSENRFRRVSLAAFLLLAAILLLPFVLLGLFFWGLWRLAQMARRHPGLRTDERGSGFGLAARL